MADPAQDELARLRAEVDRIDDATVALLLERLAVVRRIGDVKTATEVGEMVEDMMAEAQTELRAAREEATMATGAAAAGGATSEAQAQDGTGEQPPEGASGPGAPMSSARA